MRSALYFHNIIPDITNSGSYKLNTIIFKAKVELLFMEPYTIISVAMFRVASR